MKKTISIFSFCERLKYKIFVHNKNVTLITNTCIGGVLYNLFSSQFKSPTINLYILPDDFVKMCCNLEEYLNYELWEYKDNRVDYPCGILGDIEIFFKHYKTFAEAKKKWITRKSRINWNNIKVIMTDRVTAITDKPYACPDITIQDFGHIPYPKIVFTSKKYNYDYSYWMLDYENDGVVGVITETKNKFGKRNFERNGFKMIKFLNK